MFKNGARGERNFMIKGRRKKGRPKEEKREEREEEEARSRPHVSAIAHVQMEHNFSQAKRAARHPPLNKSKVL